MNKELKDYLTVLKSFTGKRSSLPVLRGAKIYHNRLTTTNLTVWGELEFATTLPDGYYDDYALDMIMAQGENCPATPSTEWELDDYPSLSVGKWGESKVLTDGDIDNIIKASENVSKDELRPALTLVAITDGVIAGTDGYTMVVAPQSDDLGYDDKRALLSKAMVNALKKLRKYGTWTLCVSDNNTDVKISNGTFSIIGDNHAEYGYPDVVGLLQKSEKFTAKISLDLAPIFALASKERDLLDIDPMSGEVLLDQRPTGVVATTEGGKDIICITGVVPRQVIMPHRGEPHHIVLSVGLLKRLTKAKTVSLLTNLDQEGMIEVG